MIYVSDTSPLIFFSKINKLDVMRQIFYQINIPNEVANEIQGKKDTAAAEILKANWIVTREVKNVSLVNALTKEYGHDKGEVEAVILSRELGANLLVVDDSAGRDLARSYQIKITGTLGVLAVARQKGLVSKIRPLVRDLLLHHNYRISASVLLSVLRQCDEWDSTRDSESAVKNSIIHR